MKNTEIHIDLAEFMLKDLVKYALEKHEMKLTVKYLDPKRAIRAFPANAEDSSISHTLALSSCHSAMAGYTDFIVGLVRC